MRAKGLFSKSVAMGAAIFLAASLSFTLNACGKSGSGSSAAAQTDSSTDSSNEESSVRNSAESVSTESSSGKEDADTSGVNPELKATLDAYEKIMDKYCDFMEKYKNASSTDALSMLGDYSEMLQDYTDALTSLEKIDTTKLSAADYKYYIEVTTRVTKRLADAGVDASQ